MSAKRSRRQLNLRFSSLQGLVGGNQAGRAVMNSRRLSPTSHRPGEDRTHHGRDAPDGAGSFASDPAPLARPRSPL